MFRCCGPWLRLHQRFLDYHARRKMLCVSHAIALAFFLYSLPRHRNINAEVSLHKPANVSLPPIYFTADINTTTVIATVDEEFLSVSTSWRTILGWNFSSAAEKRILALMNALIPAYFRIGGTAAEFVIFTDEVEKRKPLRPFKPVHITGKDLDRINRIAENAGWKVLLALSASRRATNGSCDLSNPLRIVKYAADNGYKFGWQLGNGKYIGGPINVTKKLLQSGVKYAFLFLLSS